MNNQPGLLPISNACIEKPGTPRALKFCFGLLLGLLLIGLLSALIIGLALGISNGRNEVAQNG